MVAGEQSKPVAYDRDGYENSSNIHHMGSHKTVTHNSPAVLQGFQCSNPVMMYECEMIQWDICNKKVNKIVDTAKIFTHP